MIVSEWTVLLFNGASMLLLAEVGFRLGRSRHFTGDSERRDLIGGIDGAVLALLGLLIGFTFAMAVERYEERRALVVEEANTVATTYLRAALLPAPYQAPVRAALRSYVTVRIDARSGDPAKLAAGVRASEALQRELWRHAVLAGRNDPGEMTALFIESVNDTIETGSERLAAGRANIPGGVWMLLIVVAGCGALTTGYRAGAGEERTLFAMWFLPLLITFVIVLIFDLSHPLEGLIRISQQPMLDLQQSMLRQ